MSRRPNVKLVPVQGSVTPQAAPEHPAQLGRPRVRTIVVTSGKGGVGKSNLAANLALALAERGAASCSSTATSRRRTSTSCSASTALRPAARAVRPEDDGRDRRERTRGREAGARRVRRAELAEIDDFRREALLRALGTVDEHADLMIIDTASGVSRQSPSSAASATKCSS